MLRATKENAPPKPPPVACVPDCGTCVALSSLTNLRDPSVNEWCNSAPERRADAAECESHYVLTGVDSGRLCEYFEAQSRCKLGSPFSSPEFTDTCASLASLTNLRDPAIGEWCNTDPGRRESAAVCESAYAMLNTENGFSVGKFCKHDDTTKTCKLGSEFYCPVPGLPIPLSSPPPPPSPVPPPLPPAISPPPSDCSSSDPRCFATGFCCCTNPLACPAPKNFQCCLVADPP